MTYPLPIIAEAMLNGLLTGAVYALVALGLTLVYGVLHIINFAHGALLTSAMFAVWAIHSVLGVDPYLAILPLTPLFFALGYGLQRFVIGPASHGDDGNILLVTLGLAIMIENGLLALFRSDTRSLATDYSFQVVELGPLLLSQARLYGFAGALAVTVAALAAAGANRYRQGDPRRRQGKTRCRSRRHRCPPCLCRDLRHRLRHARHRRLPADADLLRQPSRRRGLRARRLHHRRARRHGLDPRRAWRAGW